MSHYRRKSKNKSRSFGNKNRRRGNNNRRKTNTSIKPHQLVNEAKPLETTTYQSSVKFTDIPLHDKLQRNIKAAGFERPTEIQEKTLELISNWEDVIGVATTGTGKTGAFLIPIINNLLSIDQNDKTLVIVPTRELALQVEQEFKMLARKTNLYITSLIGGTNIRQDFKNLKRTNHVIVGTPGRLVDLHKRGNLKLHDFSILVLDEFDRMLDMGFSQDVDLLTKAMNTRKQTLLFSATIDKSLKKRIQKLMHNPTEVLVSTGNVSAEHINQDVINVKQHEKFDTLLNMVQEQHFEKVLVFAETKRRVSKLARQLKQSGVTSDEIHGDKRQGYRKRALNSFENGKVRVLVATDVAARGLDITDVTHVINYEMPRDYETYIHRVGRTGRAGKTGMAYTFLN